MCNVFHPTSILQLIKCVYKYSFGVCWRGYVWVQCAVHVCGVNGQWVKCTYYGAVILACWCEELTSGGSCECCFYYEQIVLPFNYISVLKICTNILYLRHWLTKKKWKNENFLLQKSLWMGVCYVFNPIVRLLILHNILLAIFILSHDIYIYTYICEFYIIFYWPLI